MRMYDYTFGTNIFFSSLINMAVMISEAGRVVVTRPVTKSVLKKLIICEDEMST